MKRSTLTSLLLLAATGCSEPAAPDEPPVEDPDIEEAWDAEQQATLASTEQGARLFTRETFDGNGRTCATCHTMSTGSLAPAQVQEAYARNPEDPLFRAIDSDAGDGASYSRLLNAATVTVDVTMAPNVRLASNPTARTVKLRRAVPSTFDTPRFDPVLMWDGREPTLQSQALHAINEHAEGGRVPTGAELHTVADFEKALFSSAKMMNYARTGTPPPLPTGKTASEKRGAAFFAPASLCGSCHGGPLLNTLTEFNPQGLPAGGHFSSSAVSEANLAGNPLLDFIVTLPNDTEQHVVSPDPGLMLQTGNPAHANFFKMVSLRNVKNTAPYFHDNSAKDLEQVMVQYRILFDQLGLPLSEQDIADIQAYMLLL
ncbi:cytochrome c peroxidase [Hyalangium versicolor]|uniref:cytochrome c peroxidase n=1 Tax=Hyalangium versicolor TaxID=2861190 RepID=UPI001CCBD378|nr:cytochrome c peroxidase [Hyalangium versicolor]